MVCKQCGGRFDTTDKRRKFCSLACCWQWRREHKGPGRFKCGAVPWNVGTIGVVKRNSGSFQTGSVPANKVPLGTVKIRPDKAGRERAWLKVTNNGNPYDWKLRAAAKWEMKRGPIPKGSLVHHKDGDTLNDNLSNLQLVTRAEHLTIHRPAFEEKRRHAASKATIRRHAAKRAAQKQGV